MTDYQDYVNSHPGGTTQELTHDLEVTRIIYTVDLEFYRLEAHFNPDGSLIEEVHLDLPAPTPFNETVIEYLNLLDPIQAANTLAVLQEISNVPPGTLAALFEALPRILAAFPPE